MDDWGSISISTAHQHTTHQPSQPHTQINATWTHHYYIRASAPTHLSIASKACQGPNPSSLGRHVRSRSKHGDERNPVHPPCLRSPMVSPAYFWSSAAEADHRFFQHVSPCPPAQHQAGMRDSSAAPAAIPRTIPPNLFTTVFLPSFSLSLLLSTTDVSDVSSAHFANHRTHMLQIVSCVA